MSRVFGMERVPSVAEYVRALTTLGNRVKADHRILFRAHYQAPDRAATPTQLAIWAGIGGGMGEVNLRYGGLGHAACDELGITPLLRANGTASWWSLWSRGWRGPDGFVWQMLPEVAAALEQLGWVDPAAGFVSPDEVGPLAQLVEGSVSQITVNAYERNPEARRQCISAHGSTCCICQFSFAQAYGPEAEGYIHVHHIRPLSEIGGAYVVDPVQDLRPVCPNCHAVLHLGGRYRTIDEVRQLRAQQRRT